MKRSILEVIIFGRDNDEDVINDAIVSGSRMDVEFALPTEETGNGIVGNDTDAERLPRGVEIGFELVLFMTLDPNATGEIWSPDECKGISEIDMVLLDVVLVVRRVGVICRDLLLLLSSNDALQNSIAFKTVGEWLGLLEIIEVFLAIAPTTSVSDDKLAL